MYRPSLRILRLCVCFAFTVLLTSVVCLAQKMNLTGLPAVVTHDNLHSAGVLKDGVLTVRLTFKEGAWHPEADDGPGLPVLAFAEEDGPPNIPGPLIRVPQGTRIHAYLHNPEIFPMVVHGFDQRPGDGKSVITIPPRATQEADFLAGAPGTYFYWATCFGNVPLDGRPTADTQMTGALIVDPPGAPTDDKVMVIGLWYDWLVPMDFERGFHEILTINGKSFPYTEHLTYTMGDNVRWRVINASIGAHPMHMHGAFFRVDSDGDGEKDAIYTPGQQRTVVTELMQPGRTMAMDWTPSYAGNWIFHCHLNAHMNGKLSEELADLTGEPSGHDAHMKNTSAMTGMSGTAGMGSMMSGMAGLVVGITVKPNPMAVAKPVLPAAHKLTMTLSQAPESNGQLHTIQVELRDGANVVSTAQASDVGPPIILHRGEPTEITIVNHLAQPTAIHWHGIELESYYDGLPGYGGDDHHVTPPIAPGATFVVRMTPPRAGTFIYHTHWHDVRQLVTGLYGALVVLPPGQKYDPEHDRVYVVGRSWIPNGSFLTTPLVVNGMRNPAPEEMRAGEKYRVRFVNMTPNDDAVELKLLSGTAVAHWQPIAKDGADLPPEQAKACAANQVFAAGETYDFEVIPQSAGEMKLSVDNAVMNPTVPIRVVDAPVLSKK